MSSESQTVAADVEPDDPQAALASDDSSRTQAADTAANPASQTTENAEPILTAEIEKQPVSAFYQPGLLAGLGQIIMETGPVAITRRGLSRAFPALAHGDYRAMWMGAMCSNIGTWMQTIAVQWLIKSMAPGASALWLGRATFLHHMSAALLLPVGGMLADRFDRRWIILTGNICLGLLALTLMTLQWQGMINIWILLAAVTTIGCWDAMLKPANQSLLSTLIPKDCLTNAVALNSVQFNTTRAIGPALGGVVLTALGAMWSFGFNALTYVAIIFAVLSIRKPEPADHHVRKEGVLKSLAGGVLYLRHRPDLRLTMFIVLSSSFLAATQLFMLPAIVEAMYDNQPRRYSQMLSCFGIGAVLGVAMLAVRSKKQASPWRGFLTMGVYASIQVLLSFGWPFPVALGLMVFSGMSYISSLNRFFAGMIGSIPTQMRGRISSLHMLSMLLGYPLGGLVGGWLASMYGIAPIMRTFGAMLIVILLLAGLTIWQFKMKFQDDSDGSLTRRDRT
mgnify:CR=1 FL=1